VSAMLFRVLYVVESESTVHLISILTRVLNEDPTSIG
jgi:hypothetical protein